MMYWYCYKLRPSFLIACISASLLIGCGGGGSDKKTAAMPDTNTTSLQKASVPINYPVRINDAPEFENQGRWSDGYKEAIGHGDGVVVGPGADNKNVFAQAFKVHPGERLKVIARAASVDQPEASGRFQINWTDSNDKYISFWGETFQVVPEEKKFEAELTVPAGAAAGTLYIVGGPDSVVRYTEMSVLGEEGRAP